MFFVARKNEVGAVALFQKNCTYHGLEITLSLKALTTLKGLAEATANNTEYDVNERDAHTLGRRGLIRFSESGEAILTQLGILVLALAEAGGLVTIKASKDKVSKETT